ncbi:AraC-like ligand-binding domain-containing protein [Streptomyces celluloflavus]|uniref:AraC-like ligand-binding domain-containing protein n=1 Tax=Streptomyces celluloflavus TaxID=58344 RepID=UPI00365AC41C
MLKETVFRSEELPAADRFEVWRELIGHTHAPVEVASEFSAEYDAHYRVLELGAIRVWPVTCHPLQFQRTAKLIRQSDPEQYHLALPLSGVNRMSWDDQKSEFNSYELHLCDSSRIFELNMNAVNDHGYFAGMGVDVPKALMPLSADRMDRLFGQGISGRAGIGGLMTQFLLQIVENSASYEPSDGPRLETVLIDLLAAVFARALDDDSACPPESHQRTLTLRIKAFIQQHLHDPQLTPRNIAAAHHISVSYLHRLFQQEGGTVAGRVRHQRLERARRDLADPAQRAIPIHAIAARWGFPRAADFSRAFRTAYGVPPRDYRHHAVRTAVRVNQ